jgi:hypothetical protein
MDDVTNNTVKRETDLANFDHARDDFEQAFAQVPDEALDYVPEGEDYTLGDMLTHVVSQIDNYTAVLEKMVGAGYGEVRNDLKLGGLLNDRRAEVQAIYAAGGGKEAIFDLLEQAHDRLAGLLRELAYEDYGRTAPVFYEGAEEAYPTRAADLIAWLTDHYYEHVKQTGELLEGWKRARKT